MMQCLMYAGLVAALAFMAGRKQPDEPTTKEPPVAQAKADAGKPTGKSLWKAWRDYRREHRMILPRKK